jgi:hypothetical protein
MRPRAARMRLSPLACALWLTALAACHTQTRAASAGDDDDTGGSTCGVERWDVKTGRDALAPRVDLAHAQPTTIAEMVALPRPGGVGPEMTLGDGRQAPYERRAFVLRNVTLADFQRERDSDYHLVVRDGAETMVVEIPHPECVDPPSPWRPQVADARRRFDDHLRRRSRAEGQHEVISVVGVGFFDRVHEMEGGAPNGIELHPVTGICFGRNCALPGDATPASGAPGLAPEYDD